MVRFKLVFYPEKNIEEVMQICYLMREAVTGTKHNKEA